MYINILHFASVVQKYFECEYDIVISFRRFRQFDLVLEADEKLICAVPLYENKGVIILLKI